jgi:hypothetical protein
MRLLRRHDSGEFSLTQFGDEAVPPYAILSHRWGMNDEEVTFEDMTNATGQDKAGYKKIRLCGEQASQDGLQYFWVDTCCIDKTNYAELSRAINSMFRWYRNAARCYVYLSDVSRLPSDNEKGYDPSPWESGFRRSEWFTRGWTLQELLAPITVEFFSREWERIGDKMSLRQQIHGITGIPDSALQGARLSHFSDYERFSWMERRRTKVAEDRVYALLGIFDVNIALVYNEGVDSAFRRLQEEIDKLKHCMQDLRLSDPRNDKKRIEDTKGGLLKDSYRWILENPNFKQWHDDQQSQLLWIKGDPGKGKTMLLCGIVNELEKSIASTSLLAYFFCQATDSRINNATAILQGLLYLLVSQQPSLISHIRKRHDYAGKALFEDVNAWVALSEIFTDILQDPSLDSTYLVIDALDECVTGLPKLLDFVVQTSCTSSRVKWIVSSRNWPNIEERLKKVGHKVQLSLELNAESVSNAVCFYIQHRVAQLAQAKGYNQNVQSVVLAYLSLNANNTFLWVALVCQSLEKMSRLNVQAKLKAFPTGLKSLYDQMLQHMSHSEDADLCKRILASIVVLYRPVTLGELTSLVEGLEDMANDLELLEELISACGSLLTIRGGTIYFVHQSAQDFLLTEAFDTIFPSGKEEAHYVVFSRSILTMSKTLRRDIYSLGTLGYPIEQVKPPEPDPLMESRYSCIYWIDHLCDYNSSSSAKYKTSLQDWAAVDSFLRAKYLYWLEALSLCKSMSKGVVSMARLKTVTHVIALISNTFLVCLVLT